MIIKTHPYLNKGARRGESSRQNNHNSGLLDDLESQLVKSAHGEAYFLLPDEPGVGFHYDDLGVLQGFRFMADQLIFQAFNITHQIEAAKPALTHQLTELS